MFCDAGFQPAIYIGQAGSLHHMQPCAIALAQRSIAELLDVSRRHLGYCAESRAENRKHCILWHGRIILGRGVTIGIGGQFDVAIKKHHIAQEL